MSQKDMTQIYRRLSEAYPTFEEADDAWSNNGLNATPFKTLTSVAISAMTQDTRTVRACVALYKKISTPEELLQMEDEELRECIRPAAHYNRKTQNLKKMCQELLDRHDGEVPTTREELLNLTGIGRKSTDIMMNFVFSEDSIAVDTHVHRVVNRIGIANTSSREKTADVINSVTPPQYKKHAHEWLIQHGMKTCTSQKPSCEICVVVSFCDYYHHT